MQPSQDVENAISDLIQAKEKIKHLEATNKSWQDSYAKSNEQRNAAEAKLLQATEKIVELEKEIERLKTKPRSFSFEKLLEAFVQQKKELKDLKDNARFERDSILSEIRKVLGARERNHYDGHETARQAAERVKKDLDQRKENEQRLHRQKDALSEFHAQVCKIMGFSLIDCNDVILSSLRGLRDDSNGYKSFWTAVQGILGGATNDEQLKKIREHKDILNKISVALNTADGFIHLPSKIQGLLNIKRELVKAAGLRGAPNSELIEFMPRIRSLEKDRDHYANELEKLKSQKAGARTYTPPEGHVLVEQKHYDDLVKSAYAKFPLDKKALKDLQDKVNEVHNIIDKINND